MKLTVLGSAAAEGWPALFCHCEACREARRLGGKNLRRRTSYRLGDNIQIDWGPDTLAASIALGLDMATLTDLVVTHAHEDHFTPYELYYRRPGFSQVPEDSLLTVHGSAQVEQALRKALGDDDALFRLRYRRIEAYHEYAITPQVQVTALPATHAQDTGGAYNYLLGIEGRNLLIGHDTGWWYDDVWDFLGRCELHTVIMDCTSVRLFQRGGHLGAPDVVAVRQELSARGALHPDCHFLVNHFSHNGEWLHAEIEEFLAPHGIEVCYDGLCLDV